MRAEVRDCRDVSDQSVSAQIMQGSRSSVVQASVTIASISSGVPPLSATLSWPRSSALQVGSRWVRALPPVT